MMRSIRWASLLMMSAWCPSCDAEPVRVLTGVDAGDIDSSQGCEAGAPECEAAPAREGAREAGVVLPSDATQAQDADEEPARDAADAAQTCRCRVGGAVACVVFSGAAMACEVTNGRRQCQADGRWSACMGDAAAGDGFDLDAATRGDASLVCTHYQLACPPESAREFSAGDCEQTPLCAQAADL